MYEDKIIAKSNSGAVYLLIILKIPEVINQTV